MADELIGARITTMLLCDFAQVREGLLTVVSGGVTRVGISRFPSPTPLFLAIMIYLPPNHLEDNHEVRVRFKYPETAEKFAEANVNVNPRAPADQRADGIFFPVPLDLRGVTLPRPGRIDIQVELDGEHQGDLTLQAFQPPTR